MFREGGSSAAMVMRYKLVWLPLTIEPDILAGPVPSTFDIESRFAVWSELDAGQFYDLDAEMERRITSTPGVDERAPPRVGRGSCGSRRSTEPPR